MASCTKYVAFFGYIKNTDFGVSDYPGSENVLWAMKYELRSN
jgi:hypothetical protein